MPELMLLSNSFSRGQGALEHAMDALAVLFDGARRVLFVPYASSDPDGYTQAMQAALSGIGVHVVGAHRAADPLAALAQADAVFVGGGNAFRLLRAVQRNGLLSAIGPRVQAGLPYLGVSAGANLACPTIRTTNDMPVVQPASLAALGLVPFQVNPHYPEADTHDGGPRQLRDRRLGEFLEENDVAVLGLCEGSWLRVSGARAALGGAAGGRVFARGQSPRDVQPGDDLTRLLGIRPRFDSPARLPACRFRAAAATIQGGSLESGALPMSSRSAPRLGSWSLVQELDVRRGQGRAGTVETRRDCASSAHRAAGGVRAAARHQPRGVRGRPGQTA